MPIELARIQAICFDVDGTLSDTDDVWTEQIAERLQPMARWLPRQNARAFARMLIMAAETPGNLAYTLLDWAYLDAPLAGLFNFLARRRNSYQPRSYRLVEGVDILVPALARQYRLAVISANSEANTLAFLDSCHLRASFTCVATALTCAHTKPFPDPVRWAAAQMGVRPEACLMVGDTTVDIRAGRSAGAQTVGLLCGFGQEDELRRARADQILAHTSELAQLLAIKL
jgi:phosphoglycolate phosphatase-like HAD superfamily hydrolase